MFVETTVSPAFDLDTTLGFQKERQYFKRTSPFVIKLLFKEDRIVQRLIHGVVCGLVISPVLQHDRKIRMLTSSSISCNLDKYIIYLINLDYRTFYLSRRCVKLQRRINATIC